MHLFAKEWTSTFFQLVHQHITLTTLNSCLQTAMGGQTVSKSSTHLWAKPCEDNLTKSNSQRKINIPFYHTKTPAQDHHQHFLIYNTLWQEEIRKHIAAQVRLLNARSRQLRQKDVEVRTLVPFSVVLCCHSFTPAISTNPQHSANQPLTAGHPLCWQYRIVISERLRAFVGGGSRGQSWDQSYAPPASNVSVLSPMFTLGACACTFLGTHRLTSVTDLGRTSLLFLKLKWSCMGF